MIKERRAPSTREPGNHSLPSKVTCYTLGKSSLSHPASYQPLNSRSCLCWGNIIHLLTVKSVAGVL